MRSCIYCGRDLEKDEKCSCPGAVNARRAKETTKNNTTDNSANTNSGWQENTYRTGYTKKKRKFSFKKPSFKKPDFGKQRKQVKGFLLNFINDPVNSVSGAGMLKPFQIVAILIVTALLVSLSGYFAASKFVPDIYKIGLLFRYSLTGTLGVLFAEIVFVFVMYLANRFVLRRKVGFLTFASRPVAALVPLMLFALLGVVINFFSIYATIMLVLTGVVMSTVLTYEAMRSEWGFMSASKVVYIVGLCYFIFFVILFNCFKLF